MANQSAQNSRKRKGDHSYTDPFHCDFDDNDSNESYLDNDYDEPDCDKKGQPNDDDFDPFECFTANDNRAINNIMWWIYEIFIVTVYFKFAVLMNKLNPVTFQFVTDLKKLEEKDTANLQHEVNESLCRKPIKAVRRLNSGPLQATLPPQAKQANQAIRDHNNLMRDCRNELGHAGTDERLALKNQQDFENIRKSFCTQLDMIENHLKSVCPTKVNEVINNPNSIKNTSILLQCKNMAHKRMLLHHWLFSDNSPRAVAVKFMGFIDFYMSPAIQNFVF